MVEWKKLEEVSTIITGGDAPKDCIKGQTKASSTHPYPVFSNGDDVYGYSPLYRVNKDAVTISSIGNVGSVNYRDKFFTPIIRLKVVIPNNDILSTRFLFYSLLDIKFVGTNSSLSSMKAADIKKVLIPIPSLSEQTRIVGILDTFTASLENLKKQIAQRRKQYEHYREKLLDLEGQESKLIGDLFEFKNGLNKEKKYFGKGNPIVNYTDVYHNNKLTDSILKGRVTLEDKEIERYRVFRGDVFFTRTSETPEEIGYAAVLIENIKDCTFSGFLLRARPTTDLLLPEYCGYCFSTYKVRHEIIKLSTYTTRALTNGKSLSKVRIPVPSIQEQQRIVSILDTFEASISNLEAQLEQRQKQYEYYRNKLLSFEKEEH